MHRGVDVKKTFGGQLGKTSAPISAFAYAGAFSILPLIEWRFVIANGNRMSKYHIIEGRGSRTGQKLYQVFIGGKTIGNPYPSREQAEGYIKLLEQRDAEAEAERQREAEAELRQEAEAELQRKKSRSSPSFGM